MKKNRVKLMLAALSVVMTGAFFTGCGNSSSSTDTTTISISGSTSVGPLMEVIAEKYEEENPSVTLEIQQPGSGTGIQNCIDGVAEIGMSSRDLKDEESESVSGTVIAYDGIAVILNSENTVSNLTTEQIKGIFTGEITNWSEVGGEDSEIVVVSREEGSGTRDAFQELIGYDSEELVSSANVSDGNGSVKTTVEGNENAIGYISFEYLDDSINAVTVNDVEPTADNVKSGDYVLSRPFLLVTNSDTLTDEGQALIDYILSDEGQEIVEENGLISIND